MKKTPLLYIYAQREICNTLELIKPECFTPGSVLTSEKFSCDTLIIHHQGLKLICWVILIFCKVFWSRFSFNMKMLSIYSVIKESVLCTLEKELLFMILKGHFKWNTFPTNFTSVLLHQTLSFHVYFSRNVHLLETFPSYHNLLQNLLLHLSFLLLLEIVFTMTTSSSLIATPIFCHCNSTLLLFPYFQCLEHFRIYMINCSHKSLTYNYSQM